MSSELMTIKECMAHFKSSRSTIMRRLKTGELKSFLFGGKRYIERNWVEDIPNANKERRA